MVSLIKQLNKIKRLIGAKELGINARDLKKCAQNEKERKRL